MRSPFPVKPSLMTLIRAIRFELQKISKCLRACRRQEIVDHGCQSACADSPARRNSGQVRRRAWWDMAEAVASHLVRVEPENETWWINRSIWPIRFDGSRV
jgi:hypothetical protein